MWRKTSTNLQDSDHGSTAARIQRRVSVDKLEVPYYDHGKYYFQDNWDLDRLYVIELGTLLSNLLDNMFEKNQLLRLKDYRNVLDMVKKWKKKYAATLGDEANMLEKPKEFWQMLAKLEQSIRTSTSNVEITSEEALRRFKNLLEGISRLISSSPWGAYLRWNQLTINQQPVVEYLAPAIEKLRESGGEALLGLVMKIMDLVLR